MTMEKKILPPLLPGLKPGTQTGDLWITSLAHYHWAIHTSLTYPCSNIFLNQLNQNRLYSTHTKPLQGAKNNCCTNLSSTKQSFDIVWIHLQNLVACIFCLEEHSTVARVSMHAHVHVSVCVYMVLFTCVPVCVYVHMYRSVCLCVCVCARACVCVVCACDACACNNGEWQSKLCLLRIKYNFFFSIRPVLLRAKLLIGRYSKTAIQQGTPTIQQHSHHRSSAALGCTWRCSGERPTRAGPALWPRQLWDPSHIAGRRLSSCSLKLPEHSSLSGWKREEIHVRKQHKAWHAEDLYFDSDQTLALFVIRTRAPL